MNQDNKILINALIMFLFFYPSLFVLMYGEELLTKFITKNLYDIVISGFSYFFIGLSTIIALFQIYMIKVIKDRKITITKLSYYDYVFIVNIITYFLWAIQFNYVSLFTMSGLATVGFLVNKAYQIYFYYQGLKD